MFQTRYSGGLGLTTCTYLNVKSDPLFHISAYVKQVGQWINIFAKNDVVAQRIGKTD